MHMLMRQQCRPSEKKHFQPFLISAAYLEHNSVKSALSTSNLAENHTDIGIVHRIIES